MLIYAIRYPENEVNFIHIITFCLFGKVAFTCILLTSSMLNWCFGTKREVREVINKKIGLRVGRNSPPHHIENIALDRVVR